MIRSDLHKMKDGLPSRNESVGLPMSILAYTEPEVYMKWVREDIQVTVCRT